MVLKRFGVMSCAKVAGTLYGVMGILFGGTFALVSTLGLALGQGDSSQAPAWFGPPFWRGCHCPFPASVWNHGIHRGTYHGCPLQPAGGICGRDRSGTPIGDLGAP